MLTCYRNRRRIGAYLDGALDPETARATADHIGACARCTAEAEGLRRLTAALRSVARPADPDWSGFWPGVVRGIEDARHRAAAPRPRQPRLKWAFGSALAAATLTAVTVWLAPWQTMTDHVTGDTPVIVRSADTGAPDGTVMVYRSPDRDLTVVWVFGLETRWKSAAE